MSQIRLAAITVAISMAIGALAVTGCSAREQGSKVSNVSAKAPTTGEMFTDAAVVRPMTLWASAIGAFAWVVTLPFTLPSGSAGDVGKAWVGDPLKYTFYRPLGEMEDGTLPRQAQNEKPNDTVEN